jgi:hypothetical protein
MEKKERKKEGRKIRRKEDGICESLLSYFNFCEENN